MNTSNFINRIIIQWAWMLKFHVEYNELFLIASSNKITQGICICLRQGCGHVYVYPVMSYHVMDSAKQPPFRTEYRQFSKIMGDKCCFRITISQYFNHQWIGWYSCNKQQNKHWTSHQHKVPWNSVELHGNPYTRWKTSIEFNWTFKVGSNTTFHRISYNSKLDWEVP